MGYDFDVIVTNTLHSDNYTYNVSEMYYHAWDQIKHTLDIPDYELKGGSWKEAIQLENKYAVRALLAIIRQLEYSPLIHSASIRIFSNTCSFSKKVRPDFSTSLL